jgi:maleamate amidohydrolase
MTERMWDRFLTEMDKAHLATTPVKPRFGFGNRPAVLSIDNYRGVLGDRPMPLLEAVRERPGSVGEAGWKALAHIERLFISARAAGIPIIHTTGLSRAESNIDGWSRPGEHPRDMQWRVEDDAECFSFVEHAAPLPGEAIVTKAASSAFFGTPLIAHLGRQKIDTLIVCGESTSGCVRASVVDARSYQFNVLVVEECVYDRHEASHAMNLFDMDQKYADVISVAEVISWMNKQRTDG